MSTEQWWSHLLTNENRTCQNILKTLKSELDVKLLAFDFDSTLININTGGKWRKSAEKLANHVRPCFKDLIGEAMKNKNFVISIVTFSIQPELIAEVLQQVFPNSNTQQVIIEANPSHIKPQLTPRVYKVGKLDHLANVVERIKGTYGITLLPHQILLFDDRRLYVKLSKRAGNLSFLVKNNITLEDIQKYVQENSTKNKSHHQMNYRLVDNSNFAQSEIFAQKYVNPQSDNVDGLRTSNLVSVVLINGSYN